MRNKQIRSSPKIVQNRQTGNRQTGNIGRRPGTKEQQNWAIRKPSQESQPDTRTKRLPLKRQRGINAKSAHHMVQRKLRKASKKSSATAMKQLAGRILSGISTTAHKIATLSLGIKSIVLGTIGFATAWTGIGIVFSITSLILAVRSATEKKSRMRDSIIGLVLSAGGILSAVYAIAYILLALSTGSV